ncbi:unnamed protein product [Phytomonas sp. EM1]|nr:unnamed protein product [Phytomonas sp. EM1]|eukprot:CCW65200.1 unnamed protein product [Phytomonas sp. isolate EM1]
MIPRESLITTIVQEQQIYHEAFGNLARGLKAIQGTLPSPVRGRRAGGDAALLDDNDERVLEKGVLNQRGRRLLLIFLAAKVVVPLLISSRISTIDFATFSIIVLSSLKHEEAHEEKMSAERQAWRRIVNVCFGLLS